MSSYNASAQIAKKLGWSVLSESNDISHVGNGPWFSDEGNYTCDFTADMRHWDLWKLLVETERDKAENFRCFEEMEKAYKAARVERDLLVEAHRLIVEVYGEFVNHQYAPAGPMPTDGSKDTRWMKEAQNFLEGVKL